MPTYADLATSIASDIGGPDNVISVGSCTTRLRFVVKDESVVDLDKLGATPGVLKALKAGGQIQIVIGTHVDDVRKDVLSLPGWSGLSTTDGSASETATKRKAMDVVFDFLGGTFQPLIPAITGAAMVQVAALLLNMFGVLSEESPTYIILFAAGNAIFYFLPIFVGFTATQKLGANPFIGAAIAAALLFPGFTALGQTGDILQAFGMPLFMYEYGNTMFPSVIIALALSGLDRLLKRIIPRILQQVLNPTLELLILVPLTLLVFGPIGAVVGSGIGAGVAWLATNAPWLFYVIVPALWVFLVAMGIHWAMIAVALNELSAGQSVILGAAFGYQYAMMAVAIAVFVILAIKKKNPELRDTAAAASLSVAIGGITEPTLYGLILRYRKLLIIEMITAGASGAVLGLFGTYVVGFSPAPFLALPLLRPIIGGVLGIVVALVVAFLLISIWGIESKTPVEAAGDSGEEPAEPGGFRGASNADAPAGTVTVNAPLSGKIVALSDVPDPVFSGALLGPGVAIDPDDGRLYSPVRGTVVMVADTSHAVGLRTDDGVEILIHVGLDTVKLGGKHFTPKVSKGQAVSTGDVLMEFDPRALAEQGFSTVTPIVITNLTDAQGIVMADGDDVAAGRPLFDVRVKA